MPTHHPHYDEKWFLASAPALISTFCSHRSLPTLNLHPTYQSSNKTQQLSINMPFLNLVRRLIHSFKLNIQRFFSFITRPFRSHSPPIESIPFLPITSTRNTIYGAINLHIDDSDITSSSSPTDHHHRRRHSDPLPFGYWEPEYLYGHPDGDSDASDASSVATDDRVVFGIPGFMREARELAEELASPEYVYLDLYSIPGFNYVAPSGSQCSETFWGPSGMCNEDDEDYQALLAELSSDEYVYVDLYGP